MDSLRRGKFNFPNLHFGIHALPVDLLVRVPPLHRVVKVLVRRADGRVHVPRVVDPHPPVRRRTQLPLHLLGQGGAAGEEVDAAVIPPCMYN